MALSRLDRIKIAVLAATALLLAAWLFLPAAPIAAQESTPTYPTPTEEPTYDPYLTPATTATHTQAIGPISTTASPTFSQVTSPAPAFATFTPSPPAVTEGEGDLFATQPIEATPIDSSFSGGATPTFIPLPEFTLQEPYPGQQARLLMATRQTPPAAFIAASTPQPRGLARFIPLTFVLLIWALLGTWYYFTLKRLE